MKHSSPLSTPAAALLALLTATLTTCPTLAQTPQDTPQDTAQVQRTVVVEQEYTPTLGTARRVSALPAVSPPTATRSEVEYVQTALPASTVPADTMQALSPSPEADAPAAPGYVRLGAGIGGRIDAKAHYLFSLSARDRLSIGLDFDGRQGDVDLLDADGDWESRHFQTRLGLDYTHDWDHSALNLAAHWGVSNLNYRPDAIDGRQRFTRGGVHIGWDATRAPLPLAVKAETNALFFSRKADLLGADLKETLIRTRLEATGSINTRQSVGLALSMDNAFYSVGTPLTTSSTDADETSASLAAADLESHTDLFLNPYYLYTAGEGDALRLRVGAHVDLGLGFGTAIRVAPDMTLDYHFARYATLSLRATGGKRMNDFRQLAAHSPYGQILTTPEATYEPLNASVGLQISPMDGLYLHLFGGYQWLRDDLVEGDYSALDTATDGYANYLYSTHTRNGYVGARLTYSYRDLFTLQASATYRAWDSSWDDDAATDDPALAYKPQLDAQVEVGFHPTAALHIGLGYHHTTRPEVSGVKADDISNLYLHATYDLLRWATIYIQADNLLDQTYAYHRAYAAPGFALWGGLAFKF